MTWHFETILFLVDPGKLSDDGATEETTDCPVLHFTQANLPSDIATDDVNFMIHGDSRPTISSDCMFISVVKSNIREKRSSEVVFKTPVKWSIPIDSTNNPGLSILYSATGNLPNSVNLATISPPRWLISHVTSRHVGACWVEHFWRAVQGHSKALKVNRGH